MPCRIIYSNLITAASMLSVSSARTGLVSGAIKDGSGSATITLSGSFSGSSDTEYIIEIDSVAGGAEIGQATFRWSNGSGAWSATGVVTSAANVLLENGVNVKWTAGAGDDFDLGDRWYFKAVAPFGIAKTILLDRDKRYRSAALGAPNTITVDLGSAQEVKALALFDHNLTSGVTITINGNAADAWGAPAFSEAVSYSAEKIMHYLSSAQTYRYWQIQITDAANSANYIEIGEIMLASYYEFDRMYKWGFGQDQRAIKNSNGTPYGVEQHRYFNEECVFTYDFDMTDADVAAIKTIRDTIGSRDAGTFNPLIWTPDTTSPNNSWLVYLDRFAYKKQRTDHNLAELQLSTVLQSV